MSVHPITIDGIERPCANCDTVNIHFGDSGPECHDYRPSYFGEITPMYAELLKVARRLGLPRHYTSDLFRDYQTLVLHVFGDIPDEFLWAIGDTGTHLVFGDKRTSTVASIARIWPNLFWYHWTGTYLVETGTPAATESEIMRRRANVVAA